MSQAKKELLRLLAEERISLQDAEHLLAALREGYPEEFEQQAGPSTGPIAGPAPGDAEGGGRRRSTRGRGGRRVNRQREPKAHLSEEEATETTNETSAADDRAAEFVAPRTGRKTVELLSGRPPTGDRGEGMMGEPGLEQYMRLEMSESIELPGEALLRIQSAGGPPSREDSLTSVALRGLATPRLTIVRGAGVEIRQVGSEYLLTWPRGLLLLEIPSRLRALEIRNVSGSLGISGYAGPFTVDELEGPLTVHGPSSPFRIRNVRGLVRILGLAIRDGISTVAQTEGDVEIEATEDASVSVRAVSTEGGVSLGEVPADSPGASQRRRGVWRLGAGTAQLNVSTVRGRISLRRSYGSGGGEQP